MRGDIPVHDPLPVVAPARCRVVQPGTGNPWVTRTVNANGTSAAVGGGIDTSGRSCRLYSISLPACPWRGNYYGVLKKHWETKFSNCIETLEK